ncbi:DUF7147 family protein, partial [Staphylococcus saprophyticus]
QPTTQQHFQPIYIMLNPLKYPYPHSNKKFQLINNHPQKYHLNIKPLHLHPPQPFHHTQLYFNYLTTLFPLQTSIPPFQ